MVFTHLDLHNPTRRQRELMSKYKVAAFDGISWDQAKVLIKEAVKARKKQGLRPLR